VRDERLPGGDHRSGPAARRCEHVRVQDRNFVRAFTSDYRVIQSPSTPGPGVIRLECIRPAGNGHRRTALRARHRTAPVEHSTTEHGTIEHSTIEET
jgi:hypothetical protein